MDEEDQQRRYDDNRGDGGGEGVAAVARERGDAVIPVHWFNLL